jgi:N6-L-threonylcarbamoyladenine synthase
VENKEIKILAIETSCDETAVAVIGVESGEPRVFSNIVSSQVDLHAKTGGIVPEVASRAHVGAIIPVIEEALQQANLKFKNQNLNLKRGDLLEGITHIAVTNGPGLIGSLLVGFNTAKAIAYSRNLPLIPINHIEGHIYSVFAESNSKSEYLNPKQILNPKFQNNNLAIQQYNNSPKFPIVALTVSGGHTSLTLVKDHLTYQSLGETIDDAAGEAFDKVAKLLGLGYPGGPEVSKLASQFRNKVKSQKSIKPKVQGIEFPRPLINQPNYNFSFSGLKTAVLTKVLKMTSGNRQLTTDDKEELCFAFEEAVVDVLSTKALRAARKYRSMGVVLAGGVAANQRLREELKIRIEKYNFEVEEKHKMNFYLPGPGMSGDNAAMIGLAAYYRIIAGKLEDWRKARVDSNSKIV